MEDRSTPSVSRHEFGQGNEASTDIRSPTTPLNQDRSAEWQSSRRSSIDGTEEGPVMDLEDKPRPPPQLPSGTPAGLDENLDPLDESPPTQAGANTSTQPRTRLPPIVAPGVTAASSPYVSATEEVESSDSEEPPRMTLGPAGAAMLQDRAKQAARLTPINPRATQEAMVNSDRHPPEKLKLFFKAATERFLKKQQGHQIWPKRRSTGDQDVAMESVGSPDQPITAWEYDPDDLDLGRPTRATVATTTTTTSGQATNVPRIRVSVMSELKAFSGKDGDEDRARYWLGKVKSAFIRDQAPDQEKCRCSAIYAPDQPKTDQLALLRVPDAGTLEEVLLSRQRAKSRQSKTVYGSIKSRQKVPAAATGTRAVRAVQVPGDSSDSDEESRSSSDEGLRRVYLASRSQQDKPQDQRIPDQAQESYQQDHHIIQYSRPTDEETSSKRCSHCGSRRHDDLGCWRGLTV
ncbi:unnamed protein product [Phytophthora fragariaefolia]|uniref:Unnamed protein product n=1 Tax=Phytophthora fragariaefolia TaxID=1490495 RepID=A0A9W7D9C2_9STRA|nr:unnamed protein product [Phytophthora fragariaefolia]